MEPLPNYRHYTGLRNTGLQRLPDGLRYTGLRRLWWPTLKRLLDHHHQHAVLLLWRPELCCFHLQVAPATYLKVTRQAGDLASWIRLNHLDVYAETRLADQHRRLLKCRLPEKKAMVVLSDFGAPGWTPDVLGLDGGWSGSGSGADAPTAHLRITVHWTGGDTAADTAGLCTPVTDPTPDSGGDHDDDDEGLMPAAKRSRSIRDIPRTTDFRATAQP